MDPNRQAQIRRGMESGISGIRGNLSNQAAMHANQFLGDFMVTRRTTEPNDLLEDILGAIGSGNGGGGLKTSQTQAAQATQADLSALQQQVSDRLPAPAPVKRRSRSPVESSNYGVKQGQADKQNSNNNSAGGGSAGGINQGSTGISNSMGVVEAPDGTDGGVRLKCGLPRKQLIDYMLQAAAEAYFAFLEKHGGPDANPAVIAAANNPAQVVVSGNINTGVVQRQNGAMANALGAQQGELDTKSLTANRIENLMRSRGIPTRGMANGPQNPGLDAQLDGIMPKQRLFNIVNSDARPRMNAANSFSPDINAMGSVDYQQLFNLRQHQEQQQQKQQQQQQQRSAELQAGAEDAEA
mmetsp:Transcript_9395/g.28323  ORF Transcript_9395/g.28323 Transcript_9395/m.28323 type:complete len:354 (+) Transcript_9395:172-1233(+)